MVRAAPGEVGQGIAPVGAPLGANGPWRFVRRPVCAGAPAPMRRWAWRAASGGLGSEAVEFMGGVGGGGVLFCRFFFLAGQGVAEQAALGFVPGHLFDDGSV